jgi:hypothetical protein
MTGVAATLLDGETTHAAVYLNQKKAITAEQVELWVPTRLLIIDEISFADKYVIQTIHKNIRRLKQQLNLKYGGIDIVFAGDMRQLDPVGGNKKALYKDNVPEFKDWINCYFELGGIHRFHQDKEWGALLLRMRNGNITIKDIRKINKHITKTKNKIPEKVRVATYYNVDRDAINAAIFQELVTSYYQTHGNTNGFIMIFSDQLQVKKSNNNYDSLKKKSSFGKIVVKMIY